MHHARIDGNNQMVDRPGTAPGIARLQGVRAAFCPARCWCPVAGSNSLPPLFRRVHSPELLTGRDWSGQRVSIPRPHVGNVMLYH